MKAIVIARTGGPEVLTPTEAPDPVAGANQLLVHVDWAGVNFIDVYHRTGLYPLDLPVIPGMEGAGTVLAVGAESEGFAAGDRVAWAEVMGSYAEVQSVPARQVVPVPEGVETRLAAALLLQGLTAHFLANDTFALGPGDRCLIHAGAGGVGLLLTQLAKAKGAEVFTTVGNESKAGLSRDAGADHVIVRDTADFKDAIEGIAGRNAIDVVYDGVGKATFERGLDLLRPRGLMVTFGNASGPPDPISPLVLAAKGSIYLTRPTMRHYLATREELLRRSADLFDLVTKGLLEVRISQELPLGEAAEAHRALESRASTGKVLLRAAG